MEVCKGFTGRDFEGGCNPKGRAESWFGLKAGTEQKCGGRLRCPGMCMKGLAGIQGLCRVHRSSEELREISEKCQASTCCGEAHPVLLSLAGPSQQRVNSLLYLQLHFKDTKLKQVIYSPHTRKSN